jgi:hypothetical protein
MKKASSWHGSNRKAESVALEMPANGMAPEAGFFEEIY